MSTDHIVTIIEFGSDPYQQALQLRDDVLRKPLGRSIHDDNLEAEPVDFHFVILEKKRVIGCASARHHDSATARIRQVAIRPELQGKGLGRLLMNGVEQQLKAKGYQQVTLHARLIVKDFYGELGYRIVGEGFTEIGIPHVRMDKEL